MFYKIKSVKPLKNQILLIAFENKQNKYYDVKQLFERWARFGKLKGNEELFFSVKVDIGGYGISWDDELDLSCDELWENGRDFIEE